MGRTVRPITAAEKIVLMKDLDELYGSKQISKKAYNYLVKALG